MALFRRERSDRGAVIDVSLLNTGMWAMGPDLFAAAQGGLPRQNRLTANNPIVNTYRTKDDRWLNLVCLQADRFWAELCGLLGRDDLAADPRFADTAHAMTIATPASPNWMPPSPPATWLNGKRRWPISTACWSTAATFDEIRRSEQVAANGYLPEVIGHDGRPFQLVARPTNSTSSRPGPVAGTRGRPTQRGSAPRLWG